MNLSAELGFILNVTVELSQGLTPFPFLHHWLLPGAALKRPPRKFDLVEIEIEGFSREAFPKQALGLLGQVVSQAIQRVKKKKKGKKAAQQLAQGIPPHRSLPLPVWWRMLAELRDYLHINSEPAWACGWMFTLASRFFSLYMVRVQHQCVCVCVWLLAHRWPTVTLTANTSCLWLLHFSNEH